MKVTKLIFTSCCQPLIYSSLIIIIKRIYFECNLHDYVLEQLFTCEIKKLHIFVLDQFSLSSQMIHSLTYLALVVIALSHMILNLTKCDKSVLPDCNYNNKQLNLNISFFFYKYFTLFFSL